MVNFKHAVVRLPCPEMINGLTTARLGKPDYQNALKQHFYYCKALKKCGLKVHVLPADHQHPDSTFIEDIALLTPHCAIIANPAAPSRKGEIDGFKEYLQNFFQDIEQVRDPGKVEAGDILMVGTHYFIGISQRTNLDGAKQVIAILNRYGLSASMIRLEKMLHLKTGVAYLDNHTLVATGELLTKSEFNDFEILRIEENESYAANCVLINDTVLMPTGFPGAKGMIENAGYRTCEVNLSEFRKLDGGVSCLSLRF